MNLQHWFPEMRGGGAFSIQKFLLQVLGNFKQGFFSMKLIQKSDFRAQGMFFSTVVLRKIKTRHTLQKECAYISYYLALIPPCIYMQPYPL